MQWMPAHLVAHYYSHKSARFSMTTTKNVSLDGTALTPELVYDIVHNPGIVVAASPQALKKVAASAAFLKKELGEKAVYGVTTGFGPMASHIIGRTQLVELQYNLVRSHSVGIGNPIPEDFVLAAMIDRANTFLCGRSGVSEKLVQHILTYINKRIIPIVPEHGAVGTSGDLVQLAHIALAYIGEGEVFYNGKRMQTKKALTAAKVAPYELQPKEGLSLINGTSVMTGIAALEVVEAQNVLNLATRSGALALELVNGLTDAIDPELHAVRPHAGQRDIAARLRKLLKQSKMLTSREQLQKRVAVEEDVYVTPEHIQEVYSFRCMPQILGPILDAVRAATDVARVELNAVTDNPITDHKAGLFLHGGNFHGDYIATAVDHLKMGLIKLTLLSERRVNFFLNRNVNQTFTPFLNLMQPGLSLALQGVQFVATSTTAQSQSLGFPHSLHSISTNADNQDVVSMGTDAALIAWQVLQNAYTVLSVELLTLAQAVDLVQIEEKLSPESRALYRFVRTHVAAIKKDRSFSEEMNTLVKAMAARPFVAL